MSDAPDSMNIKISARGGPGRWYFLAQRVTIRKGSGRKDVTRDEIEANQLPGSLVILPEQTRVDRILMAHFAKREGPRHVCTLGRRTLFDRGRVEADRRELSCLAGLGA